MNMVATRGTKKRRPHNGSGAGCVSFCLSSIGHERMFVVARTLCYPQPHTELADRMRELRREVIGDRRVRLVINQEKRYTVTIEVCGPAGRWADSSVDVGESA